MPPLSGPRPEADVFKSVPEHFTDFCFLELLRRLNLVVNGFVFYFSAFFIFSILEFQSFAILSTTHTYIHVQLRYPNPSSALLLHKSLDDVKVPWVGFGGLDCV